MKLHVVLLVTFYVAYVFAAEPEKKNKSEKRNNDLKLKREAPIPGSTGYHGPSHKYLPPSPSSSASGYDSRSGGHYDHHSSDDDLDGYDFGGSSGAVGHSLSGHNFGGHSSGGYSSGGYDAGGHSSGGYSSSGVSFGTSVPKIETYIVQTQTDAHSSRHGADGSKYAGSPAFGGGYRGHEDNFGSGYTYTHGLAPKIKAIIIPTHGGYSIGSFSRFGGGGGASSGGYGYLKGNGGSPHHFSDSNANHIIPGLANKHIQFASDFSGGFGGSSGQREQSYDHGREITSQSFAGPFSSSGHGSDHNNIAYESPAPAFSHSAQNIPESTYEAPSNALSPPYQETAPDVASQPHHTPSYAVGHKGLGHFAYAAKRPQVLNTDFIGSNKYESSYAPSHTPHGSSYPITKAPFKPSAFLGASFEGSAGSAAAFGGHNSLSNEYGAPAVNNSGFKQYLPPPTSDGYDYLPPSALYGQSMQQYAAAGLRSSLQKPESSYLPSAVPQTSYGPPPTPVDSYLPPHH